MNYWLVKSEPDVYSYDTLVKAGKGTWDGVRNYTARNNLKGMKTGDLLLFYHSNIGKEVVGIAKVIKEFYQDPTTEDQNWVVVDVEPYKKFTKTVTLQTIKADPRLQDVFLVKQGRLSVMPLKKEEFDIIMELGSTKI
jgi:predicted RNA-binding protein with PUA-like domain